MLIEHPVFVPEQRAISKEDNSIVQQVSVCLDLGEKREYFKLVLKTPSLEDAERLAAALNAAVSHIDFKFPR